MANQAQVAPMYDLLDATFRADMGDFPDITCAYYNGDYSMTLEEAQRAKHDFVSESIKFEPGMRVLDIGCGWGPLVKVIKDGGGEAVGLTLSPKQVEYCRRKGLDVHLKDWRDMRASEFGAFDAIVSIGALEHFASKDDYLARRQDQVYEQFFHLCHSILPDGGRMFLQTMVFGKSMPHIEDISLNTPKESTEYLLALLERSYLGSWLPFGREQVTSNAHGFKLISASSGRKDYIQTMKAWSEHSKQVKIEKVVPWLKSVWYFATNPYFRDEIRAIWSGANLIMFEREAWDHWRLVLAKSSE